MTPSSLHDASLYELTLSAEQPPHPLQLSPTTFKSIVATFLDVLTERHISATLLLKLPPQSVWQSEVDRCRRSIGASYSIYSFQTHQDQEIEQSIAPTIHSETPVVEAQLVETPSVSEILAIDDFDLLNGQSIISSSIIHSTRELTLSLAAESQLQREYFLLVLSNEFCGLVLVHCPHSAQANYFDSLSESVDLLGEPEQQRVTPKERSRTANIGSIGGEELARNPSLLGVCSFESATLRRVLEGVHQAIRAGKLNRELSPEVDELLQNWDGLVNSTAIDNPNPALLEHLLSQQIQHQQEVWQDSALFRRQAETAAVLQMENKKLLNAIRLKDEFLKTVGQELRTPLTSMKTAVTLLGSSNLKQPQRQRYIELLTQECDRQSALITSVLDLVQLENAVDHIPAQPLRLADIVPGVVSTYQPLAQEKGVMLTSTIPKDLPAVSCSSVWLRQIVINLLHNGIKFTPQGGRVKVRAKQQGDYVQIEFHDTGVGIASVDIPKVFDRFYRVRSSAVDDSGGAGLGLSIVQQLLLRCGGSISVLSKVGEGSIFIVLLPLYR